MHTTTRTVASCEEWFEVDNGARIAIPVAHVTLRERVQAHQHTWGLRNSAGHTPFSPMITFALRHFPVSLHATFLSPDLLHASLVEHMQCVVAKHSLSVSQRTNTREVCATTIYVSTWSLLA